LLSEVPWLRRNYRPGDRKPTSARADIAASGTLRPVDFIDRRSVAAHRSCCASARIHSGDSVSP